MSSAYIHSCVTRMVRSQHWVFTTLDVRINGRGWNNSAKGEGVLSCEPVFEMSSTFSLSGRAQPIEKRTAARFQCIHEIYLLYKKISYSCTTVHLHNAFIQLSFLQDRERKKKKKWIFTRQTGKMQFQSYEGWRRRRTMCLWLMSM